MCSIYFIQCVVCQYKYCILTLQFVYMFIVSLYVSTCTCTLIHMIVLINYIALTSQ